MLLLPIFFLLKIEKFGCITDIFFDKDSNVFRYYCLLYIHIYIYTHSDMCSIFLFYSAAVYHYFYQLSLFLLLPRVLAMFGVGVQFVLFTVCFDL